MTKSTRRQIADDLVAACARAGTRFAFGVPGGGSNLDVAGACTRHGVRFVLTHLEGSAAIMAAVVGEITGAPGIAVGTRGPGAASAANGVANALLERAPMIMVNDCVAEADRVRIAHQRIDQQALFAPIALASGPLSGHDPGLAADIAQATTVQPPGPIQVDIDPTATGSIAVHRPAPERDDAGPLLALVAQAQRPVIVAGVGLLTEDLPARQRAVDALAALASTTQVPVLTTYKARGAVPDDSASAAGIVTGGITERTILGEADLVIGLGFDPIELLPVPWTYPAPIVLANPWAIADLAAFEGRVAATAVGPMAELIESVHRRLQASWEPGRAQRARQELLAAARTCPQEPRGGLAPAQIVTIASDICSDTCHDAVTATVDAGAHMLVAMPLWQVSGPQRLLISSSHATMGFSLPAAIAAALARPQEPVIAFTGDGGLGMVLAELETLARLDLPVIVIVFNDSLLSLIAVKQDPDDQGGREVVAYRSTDFAAIARGCGVPAWSAQTAADLEAALRAALESRGPALIDVATDPGSYPAVFTALRG